VRTTAAVLIRRWGLFGNRIEIRRMVFSRRGTRWHGEAGFSGCSDSGSFCFGLAQMNTFLFGVGFLSTIAFDMGRSLLAFSSAVRALGDGTALLGNKEELTVWHVYEKGSLYKYGGTGTQPLTCMGAAANTVTL